MFWSPAEVEPLSALILKMSHFHPGLVLMLGRLDLWGGESLNCHAELDGSVDILDYVFVIR